ncbi:MAG: hypothetical protein OXF93_14085 [Acidobacteria bacterium]|nr:hypothetical protein [Acidobacteriota bacterium]
MTQRQQDFADALTTYRAAMAGFLKSSLALMAHTAGPQTAHTGLDAATRAELERDPFHVFRLHAALLVRKARLHVIAVLHANRNSNLHSLAVQMRPALECAGQVVLKFHRLFIASDPDSVGGYLNADYLQTMQRHTKGQLGRDYLLESIAKVDPLGVHRRPQRLSESAKVQSLEGGPSWYDYLSRFHHPTLDTLRGPSFLIRVAPAGWLLAPASDNWRKRMKLAASVFVMLLTLVTAAGAQAPAVRVFITDDLSPNSMAVTERPATRRVDLRGVCESRRVSRSSGHQPIPKGTLHALGSGGLG